MTTESLAAKHALAIVRGWQVYRLAVAEITWPEESEEEIARAVMDLWAPLTAYSLTLNVSGERGLYAGDLEGLPEKYAAQASEAADRLTRIISTIALARARGQQA